MLRNFSFLLLLVSFSLSMSAQETDSVGYHLTNRAVTLSIGNSRIYDSYLSPLLYKGSGISLMDERVSFLSKKLDYLSKYTEFACNADFTNNPSETASILGLSFRGFTGVHYHMKPIKNMNLMLGGLANVDLGGRYQNRNQNNPYSMILNANLWASVMCYYHIPLKKRTLTIREHFSMPFVGVMFSPNYAQTYYEIFSESQYDGTFPITSFGSRFQWRNKLSLDFPIRICTFRVGLLMERTVTNVNELETRNMNVSCMVGLVYNYLTFKGSKRIPAELRNPVE
ncbi:MAG TPA: DUF3316 domain-containing protein [Paludibacteraceae bacterium]|nr:DUF3316 domain-containing protein [Paludibacteraceae bacterium]HPH63334.1 DUF3316 domain-containing protein [Paludibacteraceae bacterium]